MLAPLSNIFAARPWLPALLAVLASCLAHGVWSVLLGQDTNWDFRNYHWYGGWAWLTDRFMLDIAPAQIQSFQNPVPHGVFHLVANLLPPVVTGFLLGAFHGLNPAFVTLIGFRLLRPLGRIAATLLAMACGIAAATGAGHVGELGTTFHDSTMAVFVLAALWLVVRELDREGPARLWPLALAGVLAGLGVTVKLNALLMLAGIGVVLVAAARGGWRPRCRGAAMFGGAALLAFGLTGAPWHAMIWQETGNPVLPLMGKHFPTGYIPTPGLRWDRQAPPAPESRSPQPATSKPISPPGHSGPGLIDRARRLAARIIVQPFDFTHNPYTVTQRGFTDYRYVIAYLFGLIGVLAGGAMVLVKRAPWPAEMVQPRLAGAVMLAALVFYLSWIIISMRHRYAIPVEYLMPLVIAGGLGLMPGHRGVRAAALAVILAGLVVTTEGQGWGRRDFDHAWAWVRFPSPVPADALVLTAGMRPTSFALPFFPPGNRFARIQSQYWHAGDYSDRRYGGQTPDFTLDRRMRALIAEHPGPMRLLYHEMDRRLIPIALEEFDLVQGDCEKLTTSHDLLSDEGYAQLVLCDVARAP